MPLLKTDKTWPDLSLDLREAYSWQLGVFRTIDFGIHVSALAVEPVSGLLAFGMGVWESTSKRDLHSFSNRNTAWYYPHIWGSRYRSQAQSA